MSFGHLSIEGRVFHNDLLRKKNRRSAEDSVFHLRQQEKDSVSLVELKALARRLLPTNSALLALILSEPDSLPRVVALAKVEVFVRLLHQELE